MSAVIVTILFIKLPLPFGRMYQFGGRLSPSQLRRRTNFSNFAVSQARATNLAVSLLVAICLLHRSMVSPLSSPTVGKPSNIVCALSLGGLSFWFGFFLTLLGFAQLRFRRWFVRDTSRIEEVILVEVLIEEMSGSD